MKIDDAAFVRAFGAKPRSGPDLAKWEGLRATVAIYLAELPEQEPGRDRIAVVVDESGSGVAQWLATEGRPDWRHLERFMKDSKSTARAIVRCDLPRPAQPIEVDGTVEEVD